MEDGEGYISLMDALRMQMGAETKQLDVGPLVTNGKWLSTLLMNLRRPENIRKLRVPTSVSAVLRPYQNNGYNWLYYMDKLGFGACLADDMEWQPESKGLVI